jgi:hypothetical protein
MEHAFSWGVVAENVHRIFTKVETGDARLGLTLMGVFLPLLVLKTSALHFLIETLEPLDYI